MAPLTSPIANRSSRSLQATTCRNVLLILMGLQMMAFLWIGYSLPPGTLFDQARIAFPGIDSFWHTKTTSLPRKKKSPAAVVKSKLQKHEKPIAARRHVFADWEPLAQAWDKIGSYDIVGALTRNFLRERRHASYRTMLSENNTLFAKRVKLEQYVSNLLQGANVESCLYYQNDSAQSLTILHRKACQLPTSVQIVAYNPSNVTTRTWCGKTLAPGAVQRYSTICNDSVTLFPQGISPPLNGRRMPHIQLEPLDTVNTNAVTLRFQNVPCDIPCQWALPCEGPQCQIKSTCREGECLSSTDTLWHVRDTDFQFRYSLKISESHPEFTVDRKAYRDNRYLSSQSFVSEVPLSTFSWDKYGTTPTPPVPYDQADKSVSFFKRTSCHGFIRGDVWANMTAQYNQLNAYGSCLHNTNVPNDMSLDNFNDRQVLLKKHLFHLIVDVSLEADFIDEAVWEALYAGVIPVYFGASNIKEHVPPNSIIAASDYGTKVATALQIQKVANNRELWESYHEWRQYAFPEALKVKFDFLHTSSYCRLCRWSYATKYGLGWNHTHQRIQTPAIPRNLCLSRKGLVNRPFLESWVTSTLATSAVPEKRCGGGNNKGMDKEYSMGDVTFNRTILQHDGIVDIVVRNASSHEEDLIFKMEMPIQNREGAHFQHVHRLVESDHAPLMSSIAIQDDQSRVTIMASWVTRLLCPGEGIVHLTVQRADEGPFLPDETRRIRIILEDVNQLRDVRSEYSQSPYAKLMIQDFLDPLELFHVK